MNSIDLKGRPALAAHVRMKTDPVSGDPVLLFPEGILVLNETAHAIVQLCQGDRNGHDILKELSLQYEVDEPTLRSDFIECLNDLLRRNLILLKS